MAYKICKFYEKRIYLPVKRKIYKGVLLSNTMKINRCPACGEEGTITEDSVGYSCFSCDYEWDKKKVRSKDMRLRLP